MRVVFHGRGASAFREGFEAHLAGDLADRIDINLLPDQVEGIDRDQYVAADVIVSAFFNETCPKPEKLSLFHVPGAGTDAVAIDLLPQGSAVCNCFGHEVAIAEYVMAALLSRVIPLSEADAELRQGRWPFSAWTSNALHGELAEKTIGILGFGNIGRVVAERAKAFGMRIHVANRTPVSRCVTVDHSWTLHDLDTFWPSAEFIVVCLPLNAETAAIVDASAFEMMRSDAIIVNVGRGAVVDEEALFDALKFQRIAGGIIDTWYRYPDAVGATCRPSRFPFHELPNVLMTPHMSGWTRGTVRRRQQTVAENISRLMAGLPLLNVVRRDQISPV